jgi:threonine dehydratase
LPSEKKILNYALDTPLCKQPYVDEHNGVWEIVLKLDSASRQRGENEKIEKD